MFIVNLDQYLVQNYVLILRISFHFNFHIYYDFVIHLNRNYLNLLHLYSIFYGFIVKIDLN
jgi:hypothetical protein